MLSSSTVPFSKTVLRSVRKLCLFPGYRSDTMSFGSINKMRKCFCEVTQCYHSMILLCDAEILTGPGEVSGGIPGVVEYLKTSGNERRHQTLTGNMIQAAFRITEFEHWVFWGFVLLVRLGELFK